MWWIAALIAPWVIIGVTVLTDTVNLLPVIGVLGIGVGMAVMVCKS